MSSHTLTIEDIDSALQHAKAEFAKAKEVTDKALARQKRWGTEVESLHNLKEIRMEEQGEQGDVMPVAPPIQASEPVVANVSSHTNSNEISHIDWIERAVIASGNKGITPPEVLALAGRDGKLMHRNYPYTALRNLVEAKRITKNGNRYYKPDLQFGLALAG